MEGAAPQVPGYRLQDVVGVGGFGRVHLATPERGGPPVAIKVLHRTVDAVTAPRVAAEIQAMGTLGWHPGIVRIVDAGTTGGEAGGQPFIVMEHLARGSLGGVLRREGPLPWPDVRTYGVQAATALQVAHAAGLLHRDLKPDNLLLADDGQAKLSDFGVTTSAVAAGTSRGTTGTLAYSAPELLEGRGATPATDVYALGATMFALLTGQPAFQRDTDEAPVAMVLRAYREAVPDLRPLGVPDPMARVVERAMAKDPAARPATAQDLAAELQTVGTDAGLPPVPVIAAGRGAAPALPAALGGAPGPQSAGPGYSPEQRARARRQQRLLTRVGGVAAALAVIAFVGVGSLRGFGTPDEETAAEAPAEQDVDQAPGEGAPGEGTATGDDPADEEPGDAPAGEVPADEEAVVSEDPAAVPEPPLATPAQPPPAPAPPPPLPASPTPAGPDLGEAIPLAANTPVTGELTAEDPTAAYVIEAITGTPIDIRATAAAEGLELSVALLAADGSTVLESDPAEPDAVPGEARLTLDAPAGGTFTVVVSAVGTGPFDLLYRAR